MMPWIYCSWEIFFGAEFTQAYSRLHGSRWEPTEGAPRARGETEPDSEPTDHQANVGPSAK